MKVIGVTAVKNRKKILDALGYYELKDERYEVWNISGIVNNVKNEVYYEDEISDPKKVVNINTKKSLEDKISEVGSEDFFIFYGVLSEKRKKRLIKKIKNKGGKIIHKDKGVGVIDRKRGLGWVIWAYIRYAKRVLFNSIYSKKTCPDYAFVSTWYNALDMLDADLNTKIYPIHSFDYDKYLKSKKEEVKGKDAKRAVFVSSDLPHHVEAEWDIDEDMYYNDMIKYLDNFKDEKRLDELVVAEHPNADLSVVRDLWEKYRVVKNKTAKEIRKSNYVITHGSNATYFAFMYNKPISIVLPREIRNISVLRKRAIRIANTLDTEVAYVGGSSDIEIKTIFDPKIYQNIKNRYIKEKGTPEKNSFKYMYDTLSNG